MPKRLRRIIYSFRSVFITENKSSCTVLFVALKYTKNVCGQVSARTPLGKRHLVSFLVPSVFDVSMPSSPQQGPPTTAPVSVEYPGDSRGIDASFCRKIMCMPVCAFSNSWRYTLNIILLCYCDEVVMGLRASELLQPIDRWQHNAWPRRARWLWRTRGRRDSR